MAPSACKSRLLWIGVGVAVVVAFGLYAASAAIGNAGPPAESGNDNVSVNTRSGKKRRKRRCKKSSEEGSRSSVSSGSGPTTADTALSPSIPPSEPKKEEENGSSMGTSTYVQLPK